MSEKVCFPKQSVEFMLGAFYAFAVQGKYVWQKDKWGKEYSATFNSPFWMLLEHYERIFGEIETPDLQRFADYAIEILENT